MEIHFGPKRDEPRKGLQNKMFTMEQRMLAKPNIYRVIFMFSMITCTYQNPTT